MSNQQLIKSAHIWFLTALLAGGLLVIAGKAGIASQEQQNSNQNQNQNQNSNSNSNTANANSSQNQNQNRNANSSQNQNRNANRSADTNVSGDQTGTAGMSSRDRKFLMDAAMSGLVEVELGRIAAQQGTSDAVKQFGQMMVDHHTKANAELMSLASSKGLTLPTSLDQKHQQDVTKFSGMSGADFDRAFAKRMLKDHEKAVSDFEKQSTRGTDPDVKALASKALPTLQEHLTAARALPGNERGGGNRNASGSNSNRNMNGNSNRNSNSNSNSNSNGNSNNSNRP